MIVINIGAFVVCIATAFVVGFGIAKAKNIKDKVCLVEQDLFCSAITIRGIIVYETISD